MPRPKTGATNNHALLGLLDKCRATEKLVKMKPKRKFLITPKNVAVKVKFY